MDDDRGPVASASQRVLLGWDDPELDRPASGAIAITPLGHFDGVYHVLDRSGQHRALETRALTDRGLLSLFNGDQSWLARECPKKTKEGDPTGDFMPRQAAQLIMQLCARVGLFSPHTPIRGPGFWPDAAGAISHCGDILIRWTESGPQPVLSGIKVGSAIYPAYPSTAYPARDPAGEKEGRALLRAIELWPWAMGETSAELVVGWIGAALMGAVSHRWHPHMLVSAVHGSGKTWLAELIASVLGVDAINNFSEASVRQDGAGQARGLVLDESESGGRFEPVIELIRHMAAKGGAKVQRGSPDGQIKKYVIIASVFMAAINPPALDPQDRSRITELELTKHPARKPEEAAAHEAKVQRAMEWAAERAPHLRARAYAGHRRYLANFAAWRGAFQGLGATPRQADQLGALLAGRDLMLSDTETSPAAAAEAAVAFQPMVTAIVNEEAENSEAQRCLNHLLSWMAEAWSGGHKATLGQLVMAALAQGEDETAARQALPAYGLRLEQPHPPQLEEPCLLVANNHSALVRIFKDTPWKDGAWGRALKNLSGAGAWPSPVQFAGPKQRATLVPFHHLPTRAANFLDPANPPPPPDAGRDGDPGELWEFGRE